MFDPLKTIPGHMVGRLVTFHCNFRLAYNPGEISYDSHVIYGDVGIIVDVAMSRKKWLHRYTEQSVWYKVQLSDRVGWFDSEAISWRSSSHE